MRLLQNTTVFGMSFELYKRYTMKCLKKLLSICICLSFFSIVCFSFPVQSVSAVIITENTRGADILNDAENAVLKSLPTTLELLRKIESFQMRVGDNDSFSLCRPYIVYNPMLESQDEIIYFPLYDESKDKIVFLLTAVNIEGEFHCGALDNSVDLLNDIDYRNSECICFVTDNGDIVYETPYRSVSSFEFYNGKEIIKGNINSDAFFSLTFNEKSFLVNNRINELKPFEKTFLDVEDVLNQKMHGILSLNNPQGQYGYGMCWATSAATIHNKIYSSVVTGFDICNHLGIGYNDGGTVYNEQDALWYYGIYYNYILQNGPSWSQVKNNIDNSNLFILNGYGYYQNHHAVTVYGYAGTSQSNGTVFYWEGNLNGGLGGAAYCDYNNHCFYDAYGYVYNWSTALTALS